MTKRILNIITFLFLFLPASRATVYYVDSARANNTGAGTSWATAKKDVQAAINATTAAGDEVWVRAATYRPTLDNGGNATPTDPRDKTFYLTARNIGLYGGFTGIETTRDARDAIANITTLSGDLDSSAGTIDAYHVLFTASRSAACVVDGFTIQGGRATGTTSAARSSGGGLFNGGSAGSLSISNCIFSNNTASTTGGAIYSESGAMSLTNCIISGNTVGSTASSNGGGMYNINCSPVLTSCIFVNNTATGFGGGLSNNASSPAIRNCTFYNNQATGSTSLGGGIHYTTNSGGTLTNSILYNNTTPGNSSHLNKEEYYKVGNTAALTISSCIIRDYNTSVTNAGVASGIIRIDPSFVNTADLTGPDGRWYTADDGLALQSCSYAINTGVTPPVIPNDILGNARAGNYDIGAYEFQGTPTDGLATIDHMITTTQLYQTSYGTCGDLIAAVQSNSPNTLAGGVTAKVYVQSSAPAFNTQPYVRRYYDFTPASNPNTATAAITLYFLQADFTDYNTNRGSFPSLPVDGTDAAGYKANLRITQQHGTSTTGAPGSYSGWTGSGADHVLITPTSVTYNATLSRWEVTFPVTGFSGFFAHTGAVTPLPLKLLSFTATNTGDVNHIYWQTATESEGTSFEITRSNNGSSFDKIGEAAGKGNDAAYAFCDNQPVRGVNYYRLKSLEASGASTFSNIAIVRNDGTKGNIIIAPLPATNTITISNISADLTGTIATVNDMQGREVCRLTLPANGQIKVAGWPAGIYSLHLANGATVKLIKQ